MTTIGAAADDITGRVIESLYCEALLLADEARHVFGQGSTIRRTVSLADPQAVDQIVLSCESLRATSRIMHALAWLLARKAYQRGEIDADQLREQGRLGGADAGCNPEALPALPVVVRGVVLASERLYDRVRALDAAEQAPAGMTDAAGEVSPVSLLHARLSEALA